MKISIMSRRALEKLSERGFPRGTAVISITDFGDGQVEMASEPDFLLRLAFDDVDSDVFSGADQKDVSAIEEKYHVMTEGQARELADFFADVSGVAQTLICQCEHGQSRSAAVAAATLMLSGDHIQKVNENKSSKTPRGLVFLENPLVAETKIKETFQKWG